MPQPASVSAFQPPFGVIAAMISASLAMPLMSSRFGCRLERPLCRSLRFDREQLFECLEQLRSGHRVEIDRAGRCEFVVAECIRDDSCQPVIVQLRIIDIDVHGSEVADTSTKLMDRARLYAPRVTNVERDRR